MAYIAECRWGDGYRKGGCSIDCSVPWIDATLRSSQYIRGRRDLGSVDNGEVVSDVVEKKYITPLMKIMSH